MPGTIWFATDDQHPTLTDDDALALETVKHRGYDAKPLSWRAGDTRVARGDFVVVRSCWDYHLAPKRFVAWLGSMQRKGVHFANGVELIEWNLHKRYLLELSRAGIAKIAPTILLNRGESADLGALMRRLQTNKVVVKPAISLSAHNTACYEHDTEANQTAFARQCRAGDMLVQAFVPEITRGFGEISLVFLCGEFSHAIGKIPAEGDFRVQRDFGGTHVGMRPAPELVHEAARIVRAVGKGIDYARVDGVPSESGFLLMELELIDPVLYFREGGPASVDRFVSMLLDRHERPGRASGPGP